MLRFFRKYNKFILAVFGTGLMVVFLIEPAMRGCEPGPTDIPIGYIGDRKLTRNDQIRSQRQLQVLAALTRLKQLPPTILQGGDLLSWMLMVEEARTMGLSASQNDVNQILEGFGITESDLKQVARTLQISTGFARDALRNWVMVQTYKTQALGVVPVSFGGRWDRYAANVIAGDPPLSAPLVERFIYGLRSTVTISTVAVSHRNVLDQVEEPGEQAVRDLFEQHKDVMEGQSEPYGFGYRLPDRVRLEFLSCRTVDLVDAVEATERDALEYYKTHTDDFSAPATEKNTAATADAAGPSSAPPAAKDPSGAKPKRVLPYREVRDRVYIELRKHNAGKLAETVMAFARQKLNEQVAHLRVIEGVRQIPADFEPLDLDRIRQQIKEKFAVAVAVHRDDGRWRSRELLEQIPGLGAGVVRLDGRQDRGRKTAFANYALSVQPLKPADGIVQSLRLTMKLPSLTVEAQDARFLFRITAVAEAESPAYEKVRADVVRDAKRLAAYKRLTDEQDRWIERAEGVTIQELAKMLKTTANESQNFPRREWFFGFQVPNVRGVGRDEAFVDRVFETAARHPMPPAAEIPSASGDGAPDAAPAKIIAIALPRRLSLILCRVEKFNPVPRSEYEEVARSDELGLIVGLYLADDPQFDPLSIEAIKSRIGFKDTP